MIPRASTVIKQLYNININTILIYLQAYLDLPTKYKDFFKLKLKFKIIFKSLESFHIMETLNGIFMKTPIYSMDGYTDVWMLKLSNN